MACTTPSTIEVAAYRKLGRTIHAGWADWATELLKSGSSTDAICSLAGATERLNSSEMAGLVDTVLDDLKVAPIATEEEAVRIIASIRSQQVLDGKIPIGVALTELKTLCMELDLSGEIYDFYLLNITI